ncbi:MAG: FtsW/RodA/SpoVE family cell cycle protein, partial [Neisseriaceae bacterium]|nr:FtsW/RodA/SpoVE family cell cycle protein [Neisseriaceae bacterium]
MEQENKTFLQRISHFLFDPFDKQILFCVLVIYIMSLFLLYSADGQDFHQLTRKTVYTVLGFIMIWGVAKIRPQFLANFALPAYVVGVFLLILVHLFGITVNGSTRWISL